MEDLDIEKLRETLEIMKSTGAVFLKYKELVVEFNRNDKCGSGSTDAIGFEAQGELEEIEEPVAKRSIVAKPVGYTALFGDKVPKFPRPSAEGKHA